MKKTIFIIIAIVSLFMYSCSDTDSNPLSSETSQLSKSVENFNPEIKAIKQFKNKVFILWVNRAPLEIEEITGQPTSPGDPVYMVPFFDNYIIEKRVAGYEHWNLVKKEASSKNRRIYLDSDILSFDTGSGYSHISGIYEYRVKLQKIYPTPNVYWESEIFTVYIN